MKKFSAKRALLLSVLSMVICVSMLIGSTFAWFTDSATANVNTIQSGNLKIALEKSTDGGATWAPVAEGSTLSFLRKNAEDNLTEEDANILWEPGCTFELPMLRVSNSGNLALKYQIVISGATSGNTDGRDGLKLLEVLKFTASVDGAEGEAVNVKDGTAVAKGMLVPAEKADDTYKSSQTVKISAHMDETAGNDYKDLKIENISINVVATQATYESDSNNNEYDKDATYPASVSVIKAEYGVDGLKMPAGVVIEKDPDATNGHFVITLRDEEAFLYFTQVFDRKAALAARTEALNNGTATKYEGESVHNSLNIWYYENAVTLKMDCDIDLKGATVNPFSFGGIYFDGNGHTIKNAKLSATSGDIGFFTRGATISNVVFDNIHVTAVGCDCAGVAVGSTNTNISNVTVKNSSVTGAKYTGAVVGYNYGSVKNCTVENTSVSGQYKVGGIIGYICEDPGKPVSVTGNKLTDVTVKGENLWSGKSGFVIGKIVGNWNAIEGTCNNNTFSGTTEATANIGEVEERAAAGLIQ